MPQELGIQEKHVVSVNIFSGDFYLDVLIIEFF